MKTRFDRFAFPFVLVLALPLVLAGCPAEDNAGEDAGCPCAPPSALEVSYDNLSSLLGAANVQDAVDELAARPLPEAPVGGRIVMLMQEFPNDQSDIVFATASCADQDRDVVLGGSCDPQVVPGAALLGTTINSAPGVAQFQCIWRQPVGNVDPLRVRIVCLQDAR